MRILEYLNVSMYRVKEFFLYTICGIDFYRNYSRFYWAIFLIKTRTNNDTKRKSKRVIL